jgi:hypothetical protein
MNEGKLFLATGEGVVVCQREGDGWREIRRGLEGPVVSSIIAREGVVSDGARKAGSIDPFAAPPAATAPATEPAPTSAPVHPAELPTIRVAAL